MKRRAFITLIGSAAVMPFAARAQQGAMPVVAILHGQSPDGFESRLRAFRQGFKEVGFVEGENVTIEYAWAENQLDRLPALAAGLVRRQVAAIVAFSPAAAMTAKAATSSIPIVFGVPDDPVRLGLVASLARPGGNATGFNFFLGELTAKRLELLREMVPTAVRIAVLVNPSNAMDAEPAIKQVGMAAQAMGLQLAHPERQQQRRDQRRFRNAGARTARRAVCHRRSDVHRSARSNDPPGDTPCNPRLLFVA